MLEKEYMKLKVGDKVYRLTKYGILEYEIVEERQYENLWGYGKEFRLNDGSKMPIVYKKSTSYFCSREEAEMVQEIREKNIIKKQKLMKYEEELNKELKIDTHIIKI